MLRLFHLSGVEFVFCKQFKQANLCFAVFKSVGQADGFLEQFFGLQWIKGIEVHTQLPTQGAGDTV